MRNLIEFLLRYQSIFIFLFLQIICLFLVFNYNRVHQAGFINSANFVSGNVYQSYSDGLDYLKLKEINDSLLVENARLRAELEVSFKIDTSSVDTALVFNKDSLIQHLYSYIPARIINKTTSKPNNSITINKGSKHGIELEMGVLSHQGVVGIVVAVSENYSVIMPMIHKNARVSGKLARQNYVGNLTWNGRNTHLAQMNDVPKHVIINNGDTVITSGYSSFFPPGIFIGTVHQNSIDAGSNFYKLDIALSTDFETLEYVYVVNNIFKQEQQELQKRHG